ncbi:hypothetical protein [Lysinibacillus sp. NPDC092081]|uniref:hypothetical protein n=1 Tax=Lysinibacillus sp. NPDC092081 TaxID=3364131 RepID=UPI00380736F9
MCLGLHEGRHDVGHFGNATGRGVFTEGQHDVGHFGNATGRGVFTDAGQLAVIAWMRCF